MWWLLLYSWNELMNH